MLIGNDKGDIMGNGKKSICKDTKKRIHHYLHKKTSYQPEFKLPNLHQKHFIQLAT